MNHTSEVVSGIYFCALKNAFHHVYKRRLMTPIYSVVKVRILYRLYHIVSHWKDEAIFFTVQQGCVIGTLLWNVCFINILHFIPEAHAYGDDCICNHLTCKLKHKSLYYKTLLFIKIKFWLYILKVTEVVKSCKRNNLYQTNYLNGTVASYGEY